MDLLRRLQLEEAGILKWFDQICCKYNIDYFVTYGTAIGTVRHKGFIPWDDDIDIGMLRKDYQKFRSIPEKEFGDRFTAADGGDAEVLFHDKVFPRIYRKGTVLHSAAREKYFYRDGDPKCPVWIDIFVYDFVDSLTELKKKARKSFRLQKIFFYRKFKMKFSENDSLKIKIKTIIKRIIRAGLFFISPEMIYKKYLHVVSKDSGNYIATFSAWEINEMEDSFSELSEIFPLKRMKFENFEVSVPNNVDFHLRKIYGDYMKIPDENQRTNHIPQVVELVDN